MGENQGSYCMACHELDDGSLVAVMAMMGETALWQFVGSRDECELLRDRRATEIPDLAERTVRFERDDVPEENREDFDEMLSGLLAQAGWHWMERTRPLDFDDESENQ